MIIIIILSSILVICSALMLLIILMQRPKQEGLGASFGGGMTQDLFGAQTTNVLQKATTYLAVIFFVISMLLAVLFNREAEKAKSAAGLGLDDAAAAVEEQSAPAVEEAAPVIEEETTPVEEEVAPAEEEAPIEVTTPVEEESAEETSEETSSGAEIGAALGGVIGHQSGAGSSERPVSGGAIGTEAVEAAKAKLDLQQASEETEEPPAGQ